MDKRVLLPKNKHDDSTITNLMALSDQEIEPIISDLLTWFQDINWPIAKRLIPVIVNHYKLSEKYILTILKGTDEIWKYWILSELISAWPSCPGPDLMSEIVRIANRPTSGEIEEEVGKAANVVIKAYA